MDSGHRFFGWIGIISIMLLLFLESYQPDSIPDFIDRLVYLHIPLLLICSAAILYKAYKEEGNPLQQDGIFKVAWWIIFGFGALFSFAVAAMLIRKFELFQANLAAIYAIPYSILVIAHAGLAFGIVVIRYFQEKLMQGGNTVLSAQNGKEISKFHE